MWCLPPDGIFTLGTCLYLFSFFSLKVIVQNYNSVLTLSRLYQLSDALVVHENDTVHKICSQLMNIKHISISDLNKVIAHQLGSVLQPAYAADSPSHYSRNPLGISVGTQFECIFMPLRAAVIFWLFRWITEFPGVSSWIQTAKPVQHSSNVSYLTGLQCLHLAWIAEAFKANAYCQRQNGRRWAFRMDTAVNGEWLQTR